MFTIVCREMFVLFPEIGDYHSRENEDSCLLGCNAV